MSRLRHSFGGFLRLIQMSQQQMFVFVEGWSDRNVYDRMCALQCVPAGVRHEVRTANELPGAPSGKEALLEFFAYLRRRKALLDDFKGKKTVTLFFLDKDVDDILRRRRRSAHVVYTEYYDLESYLYIFGDLPFAAAAAASLDEATVRQALPNSRTWRAAAAYAWRDWVVLCLAARITDASCAATYRRPSPINQPVYANTNAPAYAQFLAALAVASCLSSAVFNALIARIEQLVGALLRRGEFDRVFKGKWYKYFIAHDLRRIAGTRAINSNGLEERVTEMLRITIDLGAPWTTRYGFAINAAIAAL
jgi:hypothetical protein